MKQILFFLTLIVSNTLLNGMGEPTSYNSVTKNVYVLVPNPGWTVLPCAVYRNKDTWTFTVQAMKKAGVFPQVITKREIFLNVPNISNKEQIDYQLLGHNWGWSKSGPHVNDQLFTPIDYETFKSINKSNVKYNTC